MSENKLKNLSKKQVIEAILDHKRETLEDFRSNQRNKLNQASKDDMDNKHHESKTEETIHELELLNNNVEFLEKEISQIRNIPLDATYDKVQFGSLVETDMAILLVGAAQEKMEVAGTSVLGISMAAPIYQKMDGMSAGDSFELNGDKHKVIAIK